MATPDAGVGPDQVVDLLPSVVRVGWFLGGALVVALVGLLVVEPLVTGAIRRRNRNNPTIEDAISRYLRLLVVLVALAVGAAMAGYERLLTNSALVVGAATLLVGVAAQEVIGSLVSGLVLVADPEFNVGNYIEWSEGEGTIRAITLRVTRVQTPAGALVTLPNEVLTGQAIRRPFGLDRHRVRTEVHIPTDADLAVAIAELEAAAEMVAEIAEGPSPEAYVEESTPDAVVVGVHYWVDDPRQRDLFRVRSTYVQRATERLAAIGIDVNPASKRELQGRIETVEG